MPEEKMSLPEGEMQETEEGTKRPHWFYKFTEIIRCRRKKQAEPEEVQVATTDEGTEDQHLARGTVFQKVSAFFQAHRRWFSVATDILVATCVFAAGFWAGSNFLQEKKEAAAACENGAVAGAVGGAPAEHWSELPEVDWPVSTPAFYADNAKVERPYTVGVILDYQCPYSQQYIMDILPKLVEREDLYVEFYDFPLDIHPNARRAAIAARCAVSQLGDPVEFLQSWVSYDPEVEDVNQIVEAMGLDGEALASCMSDEDMQVYVDFSTRAVSSIGVNGTPATIINGRLVNGLTSWEVLEKYLDEAAAAHQAEIEAGSETK